MTSSCASHHGNLTEITVSMHKETTLEEEEEEEEEENRNLGEWLSCSRRISGTFG
jgi:hypothetical protein